MKLTRKEAAAKGATRYFGKLCAQHPELMGDRLMSNGHCTKCNKLGSKASKKRNFRKSWIALRDEVFKHYKGKCAICSESDFEVLTIDHINQDGAIHRRNEKLVGRRTIYWWLRKNKYPGGFRVLCWNCNIKEFRKFQQNQRSKQYGTMAQNT